MLDMTLPTPQNTNPKYLFSLLSVFVWWTFDTGRFSEAGLHEQMPFVIFRARSGEWSQRHFRADFWAGIASHCVQQWKLNLELRGSTNATTVAVAKITRERGWRVEKSVFASILGWPEDHEFVEFFCFGASYSMSN